MKLFPAIDIRGGKVVRLYKGDFAQETVYGDDPREIACSFVAAGAEWIHIVDLDAAKAGLPINRALIGEIADLVQVPIQTGGGVRSVADAEELLSRGVERVVLGTVAISDQAITSAILQAFPQRVAIGIDARSGNVATHGWTESSQLGVLSIVERYGAYPVDAFIVTDIDRDGTLRGPDIDGLRTLVENTDIDVIASGGVGQLDDLVALKQAGVAGVIVGKALYEGRFTLAGALDALDTSGASR